MLNFVPRQIPLLQRTVPSELLYNSKTRLFPDKTPVLVSQIRINPLRGYHKSVVERYENPKNVGSMDGKDKSVGVGLVGSPACGDVMKLSLKISEDGTIKDAKFKTFGCGSAIASSSYVTEYVIGKTTEEAREIKNADISKHLQLPPVKLHCSMLAEDSIKAALADYDAKNACGDKARNKNRYFS